MKFAKSKLLNGSVESCQGKSSQVRGVHFSYQKMSDTKYSQVGLINII